MWAKGPMPGATPKADAIKLLPAGTACSRVSRMGITGYVVTLPDGRDIASAGNSQRAWGEARAWALRNTPAGAAKEGAK